MIILDGFINLSHVKFYNSVKLIGCCHKLCTVPSSWLHKSVFILDHYLYIFGSVTHSHQYKNLDLITWTTTPYCNSPPTEVRTDVKEHIKVSSLSVLPSIGELQHWRYYFLFSSHTYIFVRTVCKFHIT